MTAPGSTAAFDAFYRGEQTMLLRFFRKRASRDAAPDLAQEVFLRVLRSGAFDGIENPSAYLTRTAQNLLLECARRAAREWAVLSPFDDECDTAIAPEQLRRIEEIDIRRAFRPTLLAMRPRTRRIFLMSRLRQQTHREIADELGVTEKAVERHVARALARCRRRFVAAGLKR